MDPFKERLIEHCRATLRRKIELVSFTMEELRDSMEQETKSPLGDKHETSRARMQSEHEKLSWQLEELKVQHELIYKIDPERSVELISNQNLVYTDKGIFFILVPLGKVELEDTSIYVISQDSPIGKKMTGLKAGEGFDMNSMHYIIQRIL